MRFVRAAALLSLAAVITSCGISGEDEAKKLEQKGVRVVVPVTSTSLPPGTPTQRVDLCFVSGDHLVVAPRELSAPVSTTRVLGALIGAAKRGNLPAGTRSVINDSSLVKSGAPSGGIAPVELGAAFEQIPLPDQIVALAQVVCTLTGLPGVGQVRFTSDGTAVQVPRADSSLTSDPVSRSDYSLLLPDT